MRFSASVALHCIVDEIIIQEKWILNQVQDESISWSWKNEKVYCVIPIPLCHSRVDGNLLFLYFLKATFSSKKSCRSPIGVGDDRINANHPWSTTQHFYVLRCTGKPCPSMRKKMSLRVRGSCIYSDPYLKHPLLLHIQSLTSPYLLTLSISLLHWWVIPKYIPSKRGDIHNTLNKLKTKKRQIYVRKRKYKKIIKNSLDDWIILYYNSRV